MKDFSRGFLVNSGFSVVDNDYYEFLGEDRYNETAPDYIYFELSKNDKITSIKVVLEMAIDSKISVIIIDVGNANKSTIADIFNYMTDDRIDYAELDSYINRFCFGYYGT